MFTKELALNQGVLLVQGSDSKMEASIHMMFMYMDLAVVWINSEFKVVDKILARRWKMAYIPREPARYVLETSVSHLDDFNLGDRVIFEEVKSI